MQSQDLPFHFCPFPFPRIPFFHAFSLLPKTPTVLLYGAKCGNKSLCRGCHSWHGGRSSRSLPGELGPALISCSQPKGLSKAVMATQRSAVPQPSMAGIRPLQHPLPHQPAKPPQNQKLSGFPLAGKFHFDFQQTEPHF